MGRIKKCQVPYDIRNYYNESDVVFFERHLKNEIEYTASGPAVEGGTFKHHWRQPLFGEWTIYKSNGKHRVLSNAELNSGWVQGWANTDSMAGWNPALDKE